MRIETTIIFMVLVSANLFSQSLHYRQILPGEVSFRGLSVPDDRIVWVSGSQGWTGLSVDGGKTWETKQVEGFVKSDFRTLYAFDEKKAVIANAGSPAVILITHDGGMTWKKVYEQDHPDAFIDGVDFWNEKEGLMYGDPIDGKMLLIRTSDGGSTWVETGETGRPLLAQGEASFAASGTGIRCFGDDKVMVATGGTVSRQFFSSDKGEHWTTMKTPIIQGRSSTGIFSMAYQGDSTGVIVGGDFQRDSLKQDQVFFTRDGGRTWLAPSPATRGYRECVEFISENVVIAVGPSGMDISKNGGASWLPFSEEKGFHVVRRARKGSLVIFAGAGAKVGFLQ